LCRETWVVREKGSATRDLFERWLHAAGGKLSKTIELNSPEGIKAMVGAGIGISFLSIHAIRDEWRRKQVRLLPITGLHLTRPIYLVMHPDKHVSPDVGAIRESIRRGLRGSAGSA
jgi:DNA-binding transcriptional LysR family regulator